MSQPIHFYHFFAGESQAWRRIAGEHFTALREAEFDGPVFIGLVGHPGMRIWARNWLDSVWPGWSCVAEADYGYEQVTLTWLHDYAQDIPPDVPVLYAHTKGAWRQTPHQDFWRQCMQDTVVRDWRLCLEKLDEGYDCVGAHWLKPDGVKIGTPMFAGNFWWASAGYLAGLPPVMTRDRWDAEAWVGLDDPRAFDFVGGGWPGHHDPFLS